MTSGNIQPEVRSAAQHWFLRLLSSDCSADEREAFEHWRIAEPTHDVAYRMVEDVWQGSVSLGTDPSLEHLLHQARHLPPERSWRQRATPALAMAACLVLAIGVGYYVWQKPGNVPAVTYATATGEQRTLALDDGSHVVLDTNSDLQVQYGKRERRLTLLQGQADFQVHHDTTRPFVVHVGDGTVTATGTQFQVRAAAGIDTVTLLEGRVVVAGGAKPSGPEQVALHAGERVAIQSDGRLGTPERLADTELAGARGWTEGMLVVREWPLARLVVEMNRYSSVPVRLGDPSLGTLPISGSFNASDQHSFLLSLEYGWPIRIDRHTPGEIVLRRK
ncbi:MAG TPA: FecR family protein [Rhodanobacter sp.]|nr:FecR family protein [Rhodanobacter sp.]